MSTGRNQVHPRNWESVSLGVKANTAPGGANYNDVSFGSSSSGFRRFREIILESETNIDDVNLMEIPEYRRVRIVGQGSFGVAVLYEKKNDGSHVVIKQINLSDLTSAEREMAMNEVEVFSKLHHPNIIQYFDSFIRRETLLIEMEYADGGTLATMIGERDFNDKFPERQILKIIEQITSAVSYMHTQNIIHRDLKTANIFLNSKGVVKIGDFGISKIINTKIIAQTILGTPYYFSPEMCEGRNYDEKSDIWAIGCVLGEMCCLKKAFSASNLSELVHKIMIGQYNPIPSGYSDGLRYLLKLMFKINPIERPSANEILQYWIPFIHRSLGKINGYAYQTCPNSPNDMVESIPGSTVEVETRNAAYLNQSTATMDNTIPVERHVLYQLKSFGSSTSMLPIQLPANAKIKCVSASENHFIAVMGDGRVYTWGEGNKGQLGHNAIETWKHFPTRVDALGKYVVVGACAGDGFSIFWTDLGVVLSCGDNSNGCLGQGNELSLLTPKRIDRLDNMKIVQVACGTSHVLCLTSENDVYKWGASNVGALGFGNQTNMLRVPNRLLSSLMMQSIKDIKCGPDCSFIVNKLGEVYCCGSNAHNKLGFGKSTEKVTAFRKIPIFGSKKIMDLSASTTHTAFVIEGGYVILLGNNDYGQRGLPLETVSTEPNIMTSLERRFVTLVKCDPTYTLALTDDNHIVFWGTRYGIPENDDDDLKNDLHSMGNSTTAFTNFLASVYKAETITDPIDIMACYASKEQVTKGYYVTLKNVFPLTYSILVLVETTTPLCS